MARICVVTADPAIPGGVRAKLIAFLRYAESRGHVCDVYYAAERPFSADVTERIRAIRSVSRLQPIAVPPQLPHFARTAFFARRFRPLAHYDAHQLVSAWLNLGLAFLHREVPFATWIAGTSTAELAVMARTRLRHWYFYNSLSMSLLARQEGAVGRRAAAILADSRYSAEDLQRELGLPPASLEVLTSPVDLQCFRPGAALLRPRRYVLSASRLFRGKGFSTLLEAFRTVVQRVGDVELRIAGDGSEREALEARSRELGISAQVRFVGWLDPEELAQAYRGATLFALASERETLCIAILEAMACGLPVISTDCGGPTDHVRHGQTGFLTPVGDAAALAAGMIALLEDPGLAERMGKSARERAVLRFSPEVIFAALDEIYARVFGVRPAAELPPA